MKLAPPNITPGDWHVESEFDNEPSYVLSEKGEEIATCPPVFIFGEEKANVRLIASSPKMAKALAGSFLIIRELAQQHPAPELDSIVAEFREALTEAGYTIEL